MSWFFPSRCVGSWILVIAFWSGSLLTVTAAVLVGIVLGPIVTTVLGPIVTTVLGLVVTLNKTCLVDGGSYA